MITKILDSGKIDTNAILKICSLAEEKIWDLEDKRLADRGLLYDDGKIKIPLSSARTDSPLAAKKQTSKVSVEPTQTSTRDAGCIPHPVVNCDSFALTDDQEVALEKMKQFIESKRKYFRLTGYAGTGKSYLTVQRDEMVT